MADPSSKTSSLAGYQISILARLDAVGGFTTRRVAVAMYGSGGNMRAKSAAMRLDLLVLMKRGLVALLDDQKPAAWVRTRAGSDALEDVIKEEAGHAA